MFKIAAGQIPSCSDDLAANIAAHVVAITAAARHRVSLLIFPELSLTGYEPESAAEHAIAVADHRLLPLSQLAQRYGMQIVVGAPLKLAATRPYLGGILFAGDGSIDFYAKMHLGGNEAQFYTPGILPRLIMIDGQTVGLAICADTSRPAHPKHYAAAGATVYAASVFLTAEWYASDSPRFATYAARHRLLTLMANQGDSTGTLQSVGNSAIWSPTGELLAQADGCRQSLVIASLGNGGEWQAEAVSI